MKLNGYLLLVILLLLGITTAAIIYHSFNSDVQHAGKLAISKSSDAFSGNFSPDSDLGKDGDYYIDQNVDCMYGPKKDGRWPTQCEVIGRVSVRVMNTFAAQPHPKLKSRDR
jgi:hypothetical protein